VDVGLVAAVEVSLDRLALRVDLAARAGETVAVLGPNGAGKTTLLRALAGLVALSGGRVVLDDVVLDDVRGGVHVPTERRPVGFVFQENALFPHLSALDNVAFGLRAGGRRRHVARGEAADWLARLGLADHARARPAALSGGQAQRVALARALATRPRLLLLDEPLAALDAGIRPTVRRALRRDLADFGGVRVMVTHDPVDAMVLADRLVVVESGSVAQSGPVEMVTRRPRSPYVARLVGVNLLRGRSQGGAVVLASGGVVHPVDPPPAGDSFAVIRPQAVALHPAPPSGTPRNVWPGTVADLTVDAARVRVDVVGVVPMVAEVTTAAVADLGLRPGAPVWAAVKATDVDVYPA
jgi:molybdate transport system ATP-binding protein